MRTFGSISRSAPTRPDRALERPESEPREDREAHGRALIPVQPFAPGEGQRAPGGRPAATFLAHVIAIDQQMPQTRTRSRAAPEVAAAAYAAALARAPTRAGRFLRRWV